MKSCYLKKIEVEALILSCMHPFPRRVGVLLRGFEVALTISVFEAFEPVEYLRTEIRPVAGLRYCIHPQYV